jgi:hypothetical protein
VLRAALDAERRTLNEQAVQILLDFAAEFLQN